MLGIMDTGGGMRDAYGCGVFDWLMDQKIEIPYCLGVSAGSANCASYLSHQRGRNLRFYTKYQTRKEYLGPYAYLTSGSLFNLDYIYSTLADKGGEDEFDMAACKANPGQLVIAVTDAETGKPVFFTKDDLGQNELTVIKASCAIPVACKPIEWKGRLYFDGGVGDPIPYKKAFEDGCDRLIVILSRPMSEVREPEKHRGLYHTLLRKYPAIVRALDLRHSRYNSIRKELRELEGERRVVILAPKETFGIKNTCRDGEKLKLLYEAGYADAERVLKDFAW